MTANFTSPPWINKFFNFNIKQTYLTNILLLFLNLTSLYLNTLMPFFFKAFDTTFVEVLRLPLNYKGPHELHQLLTQTNTQCRASLGDILCRHIFPSLHLPDSPFAASESTLYLCCQGNYVRNKVKNVTYVHKQITGNKCVVLYSSPIIDIDLVRVLLMSTSVREGQ